MRRQGFTLVEIMVVAGIAGIIIVSAITPLTFTAKMIADTQKEFHARNKERFVVTQIFQDVREIVDLNVSPPFRLQRDEELGDVADDVLMLWTKTPTYARKPVACVVYRVLRRSVMDDDRAEGLYRWVIQASKQPGEIEDGDLKQEEGRLVLPGIKGVRFTVLSDSEWVDEYEGVCPEALRVTLVREESEAVYEAGLSKF